MTDEQMVVELRKACEVRADDLSLMTKNIKISGEDIWRYAIAHQERTTSLHNFVEMIFTVSEKTIVQWGENNLAVHTNDS